MDLSKRFKTNTISENEGVTVDLGEGASVTVARLGNKAYKAAYEKKTTSLKHAIRSNALPEDKAEQIFVEVIAETVLLGWAGIQVDGVDYPYSYENAVKLLSDPEYKDFRGLVIELAGNAETFRAEAVETATKN